MILNRQRNGSSINWKIAVFVICACGIAAAAQAGDDTSTVLQNCVISGNRAPDGAGIYLDTGSVEVVNCTISGNVATNAGGGLTVGVGVSPVVVNTIIWGNAAPSDKDIHAADGASPAVRCSNVGQDGYAGTDGNISADPRFVDAANGNLSLCPVSPAVGTGDPDAAPAQDRNGVSRTEPVDMGAYELNVTPCTLYVDPATGSDSFTGLTEADGGGSGPKKTLQAALDASIIGGTVIAAPGTYTGTGNVNIDFKGKRVTLVSSDGRDTTIIDCAGAGRAFSFHSGENEQAVLDGFTIIGGDAGTGVGGAILLKHSGPVILNCSMQGNKALRGGGMALDAASGRVENCVIVKNSAAESDPCRHYVGDEAGTTTEFINCVLDDSGETVVSLGGFSSCKRYVYDLDPVARTPDRDFSVVDLGWSTQVETAPYEEPDQSIEHVIVRTLDPDAEPLNVTEEDWSIMTGNGHPADIAEKNARVLFVGSLLDGSVTSVTDANITQHGLYTYKVFTRLSDPSGMWPTAVLPGDEVVLDSGSAFGGDMNLDENPPVVAMLGGHPADGAVRLSWRYVDPADGSSAELEVDSCTIRYQTSDGLPVTREAGDTRWYQVTGLTNGCAYTFSVVTRDAAGNTSGSNSVTVTPRAGGSCMFDVSSLNAWPGATQVHLRWRYDGAASVALAGDGAIGFLVHRSGGGTDKLVAALPVRLNAGADEAETFYSCVDDTAESGTTCMYRVAVINKANIQSPGTMIPVVTVDPAAVEDSPAFVATGLTAGEPAPGYTNREGTWTGSANGAFFDLAGESVLPEDAGVEEEEGFACVRVPSRNAPSQFYQTILQENPVCSLMFTVRVMGLDPYNQGVTILKFKNLDDGTESGAKEPVRLVRLFNDRVQIGDLEGRFYHGGRFHDYVITRAFDEFHLYIYVRDFENSGWREVALSPAGASAPSGTAPESGNAFLRFGAESANGNIVTTWKSVSFLHGVIDHFPTGEPWADSTVPHWTWPTENPGGLAVDDTVPGTVHASWIASGEDDLACYLVTIDGMPGFRAFVSGTEVTPSISIPIPVPVPYTFQVRMADHYGNISDLIAAAFTVLPSPSGMSAVCGSMAGFDAAGYTASGQGEISEMNGWITLSGGAAYTSPEVTGGEWSVELTCAVAPDEETTDSGVVRTVPERTDILRIVSPDGVTRILSVCRDTIEMSSSDGSETESWSFVSGCSSRRLRLISTGGDEEDLLYVFVDNVLVGTTLAVGLERLTVGSLDASQSPVHVNLLVVACDSTGAPDMTALVRPADPAPPAELTLDEASCVSDESGITLAWTDPAEDVSVIEAAYHSPGISEWTTAVVEVSEQVLPARYLAGGLFVPVTSVFQPKDGNPFQVILKATPVSSRCVPAVGSARPFMFAYARSGGSDIPSVPIWSEQLTSWKYCPDTEGIDHTVIPFPSFVMPGYGVDTGGAPGLIEDSGEGNDFIRADYFQTIVPLAESWSFSAFVTFDGFKGTVVQITPNSGEELSVTYDGNELHIGEAKVPLVGSKIQHLRFVMTRVIGASETMVNLFVNLDPAPLSDNTDAPYTLFIPAVFGQDSTVRFGNVAYEDGAKAELTPTTWSRVALEAGGQSYVGAVYSTPLSSTGAWEYLPADIAEPAPQRRQDRDFVHLRAGETEPVDLVYDTMAVLADEWTMEFAARSVFPDSANAVNTIEIANPDFLITVCPDETSAVYRVVHTPEGTTVFKNGTSVTKEGVFEREALDARKDFMLRITADANSALVFEGLRLVTRAIDATDVLFTPLRGICHTTVADPDPEKNGVLFASAYLSVPGDLRWVFDARLDPKPYDASSGVPFGQSDQVLYAYYPGSYGVTAIDVEPATEDIFTVGLSGVDPGVQWMPPASLGVPESLSVIPRLIVDEEGGYAVSLFWTAGPGDAPDEYLVLLSDPELGVITIDEDNVVTPEQVEYSFDVVIPEEFAGRTLDIRIYAQKVDGAGTVIARSGPLAGTVAAFDVRSVLLADGSRPVFKAVGTDRRIDLEVSAHPDDLHGYVLWRNDMAHPNAPDAVPVKFVSMLGRHAVKRMDLIAGNAPNYTHVTEAQRGALASLPGGDTLGVLPSASPVFFYHGELSDVTVPVSAVRNSELLGESYTFTLDPYDDALPHLFLTVPLPNLGSTEPGGGEIPADHVNTVSVYGRAFNDRPEFQSTDLVIRDGEGRAIPTLGEVTDALAEPVPSWVINDIETGLQVIGPDLSDATLRLDGGRGSDRTLVYGAVARRVGSGTWSVLEEFDRRDGFIDGDEDRGDLAPPFAYNAAERTVELDLSAPFVPSSVLEQGVNGFEYRLADADGADVSADAGRPVLYDTQGPEILVTTPGPLASGALAVSGAVNDPSGVRRVTVSIDGETLAIDPDRASVIGGAFWFELQLPGWFADASHTLTLTMEDVLGNSTSVVREFLYTSQALRIEASAAASGDDIVFSAVIRSVDESSLVSLSLNSIPLDMAGLAAGGALTFDADDRTATLTLSSASGGGLPVEIRPGSNLLQLEAVVTIGGAEYTVTGSTLAYSGRQDEHAPELISVTPQAYTTFYSEDGTVAFGADNPLVVRYFDHAPGVDPAAVVIRAGTETGGWTAVTDSFDITGVSAALAAEQTLTLYAANPRIQLEIPETGGGAVSVATIAYRILDAALEGEPLLERAAPFLLARGISSPVVLQGTSFGAVTSVRFTMDGVSMSLPIVSKVTNDAAFGGRDTITVQIAPPEEGVGRVYLNGVPQDAVEFLVADLDSEEDLNDAIANIADGNGDGQITDDDLDTDGDGTPDADSIAIPEPTDDADRDGIPDALDQYPDAANTAYDPAADPDVNAHTLGYPGEAGYTGITISSPVVGDHTGRGYVGTTLIHLTGLVPYDTVKVEISTSAGQAVEIAGLNPCGLYTSDRDPLVLSARNVRLSLGDNTVTVKARREGGAMVSLIFTLRVDTEGPEIRFGFEPEEAATVYGYHSLYNELIVRGTVRRHTNHTVGGVLSDSFEVDLDSFEFRLDNEVLPRELFDVKYQTLAGGETDRTSATYMLRPNTRVNIRDRWLGTELNTYLPIEELLYGAHIVEVRAADAFGRVSRIVSGFNFNPGEKIKVTVKNHVAAYEPVPEPTRLTGDENNQAGEAARAAVLNKLAHVQGRYGTCFVRGTVKSEDYPLQDAYDHMINGDSPDFTAEGPVRPWLFTAERTITEAGAIEQLHLADDAELIASVNMPGSFDEPYSVSEVSTTDLGDGTVQIVTTTHRAHYTVNVTNNGDLIDFVDELKEAEDRFARDRVLSIDNGFDISISGEETRSDTRVVPVTDDGYDPGSGSGGDGSGSGGYEGGGSGGGSPGSGDGSGETDRPLVERAAELSPSKADVGVGMSEAFTLAVYEGDYGPTGKGTGYPSAGDLISISPEGGLASPWSETRTAVLTGRFPAIEGSPAGGYLKNTNPANTAEGRWYYHMNFCYDFPFFVSGIAVGPDRGALGLSSAEYAFVPVSEPYAKLVVDERTIKVVPRYDGDGSASTLEFDFYVDDPLSRYAENPADWKPRVAVDGMPVDPNAVDGVETTDGSRIWKVKVAGHPIVVGLNTVDVLVTNKVGRESRLVYTVDIGDADGSAATPDDFYLISEKSEVETIELQRLFTANIYGEFKGSEDRVGAAGAQQSLLTFERDGRFGRFERPVFVIDDHPVNGTISVPCAHGSGAPALVQNPGGTVSLTYGAQVVKLYVEGLSFVQDGRKLHRLQPSEATDTTNVFKVECFFGEDRIEQTWPENAKLSILSPSGAAVNLGGGLETISLPLITAQPGQAFDGHGGKCFTLPITIVPSLGGGLRWDAAERKIVLQRDEILVASCIGLETRALIVPKPSMNVYEAVTGLTPSVGRGMAMPMMGVSAEVLLHNRQLVVAHSVFGYGARSLGFGVGQTYRSGMRGSGPLGEGWYANWDAHFFTDGDDYIYRGPDGREDTFTRSGDKLVPPAGYAWDVTVKEDGRCLEVRTGDGSARVFAAASGRSALRIREVTDRHYNSLVYTYDDRDVLKYVTDDMDRRYEFFFEENQAGGMKLDKIKDFSGREYRYGYDPATGSLERVEVIGSEGQVLAGVQYVYEDDLYLTGVLRRGDTQERLMAVYDDVTSPQVRELRAGNARDSEECITDIFLRDGMTTSCTDPNGNTTRYDFRSEASEKSYLAERVIDPAHFETVFTYEDVLDMQKTITYPLGNSTVFRYDVANESHIKKYNLLTTTEIPDSRGTGGSSSTLVTSMTYTTADNFPGADPDVSKYWNFMLTTTDPEQMKNQEGQRKSTIFFYDSQGDLAKVAAPTVTLNDGTTQEIVTRYEYNESGQVVKTIRSDGSITWNRYYDSNDVMYDPSDTEGMLKRTISTVDRSYTYPVNPPADARGDDRYVVTDFAYSVRGNLLTVTDSMGRSAVTVYNELDQTVATWSPPLAGGCRSVTEYWYYPVSGLPHVTRNWNPVPKNPDARSYAYVTTDVSRTYTPGIERLESVTNQGRTTFYKYDEAGNLLAVTDPEGRIVSHAYNSRGLRVESVVGDNDTEAGTVPPNATGYGAAYDENRNLTVSTLDTVEETIETSRITMDGYDRVRVGWDPRTGAAATHQMNNLGAPTVSQVGFGDSSGSIAPEDIEQHDTFVHNEIGAQKVRTDCARKNAQGDDLPDAEFRGDYLHESGVSRSFDPETGAVTESVTDYLGRTTEVRYPDGSKVTTAYNRDGTVASVTQDETGVVTSTDPIKVRTTTFVYNDVGMLVQQTLPGGQTTKYTRDGLGRAIFVEDASGNITHNEYNARGELVSVTTGLDATLDATKAITKTMTYRADSRLKSVTQGGKSVDDGKQTTTWYYDNRGNTTRIEYDFDSNGIVEETEQFVYNDRNQITKVIRRDLSELRYVYDPMTHLLGAITDENDRVLREYHQYDAQGRARVIVEMNGPGSIDDVTVGRIFNSYGQVIHDRQDVLGYYNDVRSKYAVNDMNKVGNRTVLHYPSDGFTEHFGYNTMNALDKVGTAAGGDNVIDYTRNGFGRIGRYEVFKTVPNHITAAMTYNSNGWLTGIDSGAAVGAVAYTRTPNGLKQTVNHRGATHTYGYDANNRFVSGTYAGAADFGSDVFNLDDLDNRRDNSYQARNNMVNGLPTNYTIADATRITHVSEQQEDASWVDYPVSYDGRGNTTEDAFHTYAWDAFDRLTEVGNKSSRMQQTDHTPEETVVEYITVDVDGESRNARVTTLVFDADGIETPLMNFVDLVGVKDQTLCWVEFLHHVTDEQEEVWYRTPVTAEDGIRREFLNLSASKMRIMEVENAVGEYDITGIYAGFVAHFPWKRMTYTYDGHGRRVAKIVDNEKYRYVYDGYQLIEVRRIRDNRLEQQFVYGEAINEPLAYWDRKSGEQYFYARDDLSSVIALMDTNGTVVERYEYTAYGQTRIIDPSTGEAKYYDHDRDDYDEDGLIDPGLPGEGTFATPPVPQIRSDFDNPFGYAGMWRDGHTGLYHTHYREYNPNMGRWLTPDPAGYVDGQNLYAAYFVSAGGVDPLGLAWVRLDGTSKNKTAAGAVIELTGAAENAAQWRTKSGWSLAGQFAANPEIGRPED